MAWQLCGYLVSLLWTDGIYLCGVITDIRKNTLNTHTVPGLNLISRHSLGIYGFHAFIIHALRTRGLEFKTSPLLDILWIFSITLISSLLLSVILQKIDRRRLVS